MFVKSLVALSATSSALVVRRNLGYNTEETGADAGKITAAAHGLENSDKVYYVCGGTTAAPGCQEGLLDKQLYVATKVDADNFTLKLGSNADGTASGDTLTYHNAVTSSDAKVGASTNKFSKVKAVIALDTSAAANNGQVKVAADQGATVNAGIEYLLYCNATDKTTCSIDTINHGDAMYGAEWDGATATAIGSVIRTESGTSATAVTVANNTIAATTTHKMVELYTGADKVEVSPVAAAAGSGSAMRTLTMFGTGVAALAAVFMA